MDRKIKRLMDVAHKQIDNLSAYNVRLDAQVQELLEALKQLQEELGKEKKFVAAAMCAGETDSKVVIYDNEAYWQDIAKRRSQLQEAIDKCETEMIEVRAEIEEQYQLQQQYQILLDRSLAKQALRLQKEEQDELDEHTSRKLTQTT